MPTDNEKCLLCRQESILTNEHIIPESIGGKLTSKIFCANCNNTMGSTIDAEVFNKFNILNNIFLLKKSKQSPATVMADSQNQVLLFDGVKYSIKEPIIDAEFSEDGSKLVYLNVKTWDKKRTIEIASGFNKKHNTNFKESDVHLEKTIIQNSFNFIIEYENSLILRAVSKIAFAFLCTKLPRKEILKPNFNLIRKYISIGCKNKLAAFNFNHTKFMCDYNNPLHKISISYNKEFNRLVGFVMLFGFYRYSILLSNNYNTNIDLNDFEYNFNPVSQKEIIIKNPIQPPLLSINEIITPKHDQNSLKIEFDNLLEMIIKNSNVGNIEIVSPS